MKTWKTILGGFLLVALTLLVVVSAMSLAVAESNSAPAPFPKATETLAMVWYSATPDGSTILTATGKTSPTIGTTQVVLTPTTTPAVITEAVSTRTLPIPTQWTQPSSPPPQQSLSSSTAIVSGSPTSISLSHGFAVTPTFCSAPAGWVPYTIQPGDSLQSLSFWVGVPADDIRRMNCLKEEVLHDGAFLFLPRLPSTSTIQPDVQSTHEEMKAACGQAFGWEQYRIRPGDTLYSISRWSGTSIAGLQAANCMGGSTTLRAGNTLLIPAGKHPPPPVAPAPQGRASPSEPVRLGIPYPILPPGQVIMVPIPIPPLVTYWVQGIPGQYIDPNNSAWQPITVFPFVIYSLP